MLAFDHWANIVSLDARSRYDRAEVDGWLVHFLGAEAHLANGWRAQRRSA
jgi:hypothetical protein